MENRLFLLLVNPAAGSRHHKKKLDKTVSFLEKARVKYLQYFTEVENSIGLLSTYLKENPQITDIIILGGDGTINICLNALPHFEYTVSVISNGRGNDSVKNLYSHRNFQKQLENTLYGQIKLIDLGRCNDRLFLNGIGLGIDGLVVQKLNSKKKKKKGLWPYLSILLQLLPQPKHWNLQIEIDGREMTKKIYGFTASKGTTFGGVFVTNPKAKNNDGLIDISILGKVNLIEKMIVLPWVFIGKHGWSNKVNFLKGRAITIDSDRVMKAHIDGELFEDSRFQIEVLPQKLHVRI